jgi:hypothetical protein
MIIAAVAATEPDAADSVRGGDAAKHSEASRHIEVLIAITLI